MMAAAGGFFLLASAAGSGDRAMSGYRGAIIVDACKQKTKADWT